MTTVQTPPEGGSTEPGYIEWQAVSVMEPRARRCFLCGRHLTGIDAMALKIRWRSGHRAPVTVSPFCSTGCVGKWVAGELLPLPSPRAEAVFLLANLDAELEELRAWMARLGEDQCSMKVVVAQNHIEAVRSVMALAHLVDAPGNPRPN